MGDESHNQPSKPEFISSWFTTDDKPAIVECTNKYKGHRVELACLLRDLFSKYELPFFLEGGTALGAYRSGSMIPHDDDFDFGVYGEESLLTETSERLRRDLCSPYEIKLVTTYCKKLEVYDPTHGKMTLHQDIEFHNVTVDLLLYKNQPADDNFLQIQYFKRPYHKIMIRAADVFPRGEAQFEGETFPCAGNLRGYLETYYGYLGEDSYYDPETNLYKKKEA